MFVIRYIWSINKMEIYVPVRISIRYVQLETVKSIS